MNIRIEPATAARWPDVVSAFGQRSKDANSCWCQRFRRHEDVSNRDALARELEGSEIAIGLLAYVDDQPAGWTRVVPRHTLAGIGANRALQRILDADDSAWWVACFAIRREYRGHGVGGALLRAAADHACENGASVLDGHPVDVANLRAQPSPSALFTGTLTMFQAAGFREIGRTYRSRPVMRKDLG